MSDFDPINVDFLINSHQVKADAAKVKADITGVDATAEKSAKHTGEVVQKVYAQNIKEVHQYTAAVNQSAAATVKQGQALAATKPQWNGLSHNINQITRELPAFAVSAQIGILALSNNIPMLADQIVNLKKQNELLVASGQKGVPVWKSITGALFGWQTALSLAVTFLTIYGREVGAFFSKLFKGKAVIDQVKEAQVALNKAYESTDYGNAVKDVLELEANIDLAKRGMVDAKSVVEEYNDTLGRATGTVDDLAEAEQKLIENKDAYIQMMLYKAAANLALDNAAKQAYETLQERQALEEDIAKQQETVRRTQEQFNNGFGGNDNVLNAQKQRLQELRKALSELNTDSEKAIAQRNALFKKLNETAASFGLNTFLDSNKKGKEGPDILKARQALLDRLSALDAEYARKRFDKDEEELLALRDKFDKIRELVERFNADPKNKDIKIAIADVNAAQAQAEENLIAVQQEEIAAKAEAERKKEMERAQQDWKQQLAALRDYEQERYNLVNEFEVLKNQLIESGKERELAVLAEKHREELNAIDDAQIKKLASYKALFGKVEQLTKAEATRVIAEAKLLANTQRMSAEARLAILQKIAQAEAAINDKSIYNIQRMASAFGQLGSALSSNGFTELGGAINGLSNGLGGVLELFYSDATTIDAVVLGVNGLIQLIDVLASSAKQRKDAEQQYYLSMIGLQNDYNLSLQEQLRLQSELAENVFVTDYTGRLKDGLTAATEAQQKYMESLSELSKATVKSGQRNAVDLGNVGKAAGGGALVGAAVGSIVPIVGTAIGALVGGAAGAIAGLLGGKKKKDTYTGLLAEYPELVQQTEDGLIRVNKALAESLIANGMVNEETKQILENILAWDEALEAARDQIKAVVSDLAGGLGDDLRNSLVEAFRAGEDAAIAMGDSIEKTLENVLANLLYSQIFSGVFDNLEKELADSFDLNGDQNWIDDFGRFFEMAQKLIPDYEQALKDAQEQAEGLGLGLFGGGDVAAESGLKGAIKRQMTEETASELTGLYRATFDLQRRQLLIAEDWYVMDQRALDATMGIMASSALTEENTRNTVLRLDDAVKELKEISKNTKQGTGYDKGF